jgi:hypothetical protein
MNKKLLSIFHVSTQKEKVPFWHLEKRGRTENVSLSLIQNIFDDNFRYGSNG